MSKHTAFLGEFRASEIEGSGEITSGTELCAQKGRHCGVYDGGLLKCTGCGGRVTVIL